MVNFFKLAKEDCRTVQKTLLYTKSVHQHVLCSSFWSKQAWQTLKMSRKHTSKELSSFESDLIILFNWLVIITQPSWLDENFAIEWRRPWRQNCCHYSSEIKCKKSKKKREMGLGKSLKNFFEGGHNCWCSDDMHEKSQSRRNSTCHIVTNQEWSVRCSCAQSKWWRRNGNR